MSQRHQIIVDCGLEGDFICQLRDSVSQTINIRVQQSYTQYNYYLLFNNYLNEDCQVKLQAELQGEENSFLWPSIFFKIFYQEQNLFDANFSDLFFKKVNLFNLNGKSSKLHRLEFYLGELKEDFQLNFDLNFYLSCQEGVNNQPKNTEVLGSKTTYKEISPVQPTVENRRAILKQRLFLSLILFAFLILLFLILLFYRSKFIKAKKYKLAQRKENL
ncbi:MAG: hypothetical protein GX943_01035 [Candidatus Pacebacteria bacterium]|jgi:hypothetical protein|nr:hypothetical protein [Candidatus Paceibacterota bacterium]